MTARHSIHEPHPVGEASGETHGVGPGGTGAVSPIRSRRGVASLLVVPAVIVIAGFFLSLYPRAASTPPAGVDTMWYLWRNRLVAGEGLNALPGSILPEKKAQAFRVGYPTLAGFFRSVAGVEVYDLAFVLPALMGAVAGLGAGVFALRVLREPPWAFAIYAVVVGASVNMVLTAIGHADNLLVNGLILAAAATAVMAANGERTIGVTVVILAGAALMHWSFTLLFGALLFVLLLALLPESLLARRRGEGLLSTPSGRLGVLLVASAAASGAAVFLAPEPPRLPGRGKVLIKLARELPHYRFAVAGPAAAVGAGALLLQRDRGRRRGLALALIWAAAAGIALALLPIWENPAHRILAFAFGIPILGAAGLVGVGRLLARLRPALLGYTFLAILLILGVVGALQLSRQAWRDPLPSGTRSARLAEARTAGRYLSQVEGSRPVIFVSEPGCNPERCFGRRDIDVVRSVLPPDWIPRSYVYVGDPSNLLAGRPTFRDELDRYNPVSRAQWRTVQGIVDEDPLVLALSSFIHPGRGWTPEGTSLAPGVTVIRGPDPPAPVEVAAPPPAPSPSQRWGVIAATLLLLTAVGLGWSTALMPTGWLERVAVAPALGAALLVLGGVAAARAGLDAPTHRPWIAAVLAVSGWLALLARPILRSWRGHRSGRTG